MKIEVEIKGNKFDTLQIDEMLNDYIYIGENVYKKRTKVISNLITDFMNKYKNRGTFIISRKRNLKQFLNSAKLLYRLAGFYLCVDDMKFYDSYIYQLNKQEKGAKVSLHIKEEKELVLIYNSIPTFLESWFIYRKLGGVIFGKEIESNL